MRLFCILRLRWFEFWVRYHNLARKISAASGDRLFRDAIRHADLMDMVIREMEIYVSILKLRMRS